MEYFQTTFKRETDVLVFVRAQNRAHAEEVFARWQMVNPAFHVSELREMNFIKGWWTFRPHVLKMPAIAVMWEEFDTNDSYWFGATEAVLSGKRVEQIRKPETLYI